LGQLKKTKNLGQGRMYLCSSPKRLERPHPELVHWWLLVHGKKKQLWKRVLSSYRVFLVKAVARKKTWVVVFVHSGKKGGKTESVGLGDLHSFVVVHVARECPTAAALDLDLAHPVCAVHTKLSHLGQSS
jgi:hypothetical protein